MQRRERIDSLQVVRAFAFIAVFIFHAVKTFPGDGAVYNFFAKSLGEWGVSVFFCLSGFLMAFSYWDRAPGYSIKDSARFAWKKIKRLYPLHLIMLIVGSVYLYLNHESISGIVKRLALTIPLLQTWSPFGYQAINSVAWYLSVCVFLYFCFPFILKSVKKCRSISGSMIMIAVTFLCQLLIGYCVYRFTGIDIKWITYCFPVFRLGDFLIGCYLAYIYKNRGSGQPAAWKCSLLEIAAIIMSIAVCIYKAVASDESKWFTYTSLFIPSSILLIYSFALDNGIISKLLKNKVVFWFAMISPYAFLIHRLVIHFFHMFVTDVLHYEQINFCFVILVPFVITVAAVYLYIFIDKRVSNKTGKERH